MPTSPLIPSVPPTAFEVFYLLGKHHQTPANAVRLALADHNGGYPGTGLPEFEAQLRRAAAILDAFELHRFTLQRALEIASNVDPVTDADRFYDAKQAFINAVA